MVLLIVAMMVATIVEKAGSSDLAFSLIYHSPVFILGWAVVAVLGMRALFAAKVHRRFAVMSIHVSFVVILAGALTTHIFSDEGKMHLRLGESTDQYMSSDGNPSPLPFSVTLSDFAVVRTSGGAPLDYVSTVETEGALAEIAMNRILKKDGYRFFQAGYDEDEGGVYLAVTHDPWGTGISYVGYGLLFLSMLLFFLDRKSRFREAYARYLGRSSAAVALVLLFMAGGELDAQAAPRTLPADLADEFGRLYVNYNGRICQVQTMARDYVMKVYGKPVVEGFSSEQVFTGWLFFHDSWKDIPVKCKKKERGGPVEAEKKQIVLDIAGGRDLKIFPVDMVWYASASKLPLDMDGDEWLFIRGVNGLFREYAFMGKWDGISDLISKISKYQLKKVGSSGVLPSPARVQAERLYNAVGRPLIPAMASVTLGLFLFLLISFGRSEASGIMKACCRILLLILFLYLTLVLALRWYVSGHVPMSNGYEMMMLIAWSGTLLASLAGGRTLMVHCFGFILSGFAMLVAALGQASPVIGTLMPVLSSPLLSVHVGCMMLSYTLLGILALNGLMGLVRGAVSLDYARESMYRGILILYPALFFLTFGTFIGAIWANVSWGSYWAWDPKETWALVTILVYSAGLHTRSIGCLGRPKGFNAFSLAAFILVLITYFGVNFFLGGAHSYS